MPIYEYECRRCGRRSEELQKMSDPPLTTCTECGGDLKRLISSPSFQFKGSGWYVTDYARGQGEKSDKPEPGDKKSKSSKSSKADGEGAKAGTGGGEGKAASDGGGKGSGGEGSGGEGGGSSSSAKPAAGDD